MRRSCARAWGAGSRPWRRKPSWARWSWSSPAAPGADAKQEAPRFEDLDDLYAYFQQRYGIGKNALKKVLMKKKPKRSPDHDG